MLVFHRPAWIKSSSLCYRSIAQYNASIAESESISYDELSSFRDTINSYWGLMRHHSSYNIRRNSVQRFSKLHKRVIRYPCYQKIKIRRKRRVRYKDIILA